MISSSGQPFTPAPVYHASVDKHALVMRNANSVVDIYTTTANIDSIFEQLVS